MTHDRSTRLRYRLVTGLATGLVAGAAVLALAGCAGGGDATLPTPSPAPTDHAPAAGATHHDADTAFVLGMIPHHRQAVTMADLAATRAASPEVVDLAGRIRGAQGPEIDRMTALLTAWGARRPPPVT